jgi:CRISPR/Cas system-associated exonuclease Cas4 (RecB family)
MPLLHHGSYRDLAAAVAARLSASPQQEVIVASAGLANAITIELLRDGPGLAGLRLHTIDNFARRLLNDAGEYPRPASDAERRLAMRAAVRTVDDPMMETRGIASMLERTYRDVRDGGLTLAELEPRRPRLRLALRVWREYERLIAQLGAIDPADLLGRAAALAPNAAPQLVAGFYDMTAMQKRLIDACNVEATYIPEPGQAEASPAVLQFENRIEEMRGVCEAITGLLAEGVAPRDIGVVARALDPYDIHLLHRFGAENGFTTTADETTPLVAQRIGRGVATLLRLRDDDFPRAAVIELLRDGFQSKRHVKIDEVDMATRRAHVAGGTSDTLRHFASRQYVDDYLAVVAELEALAPAGAMSGREAAALLHTLARQFPIETDGDAAAVDAIDEVAALFRRAISWRFEVPALLDALEQQQLSAPRRPLPTIWAGDVMRFRGRTFAHLFAIRMQDDVFPQRRVEDPILSDHERREIGLREIGDGREEERFLFRLLMDGATSALRFSYAGSDGFGKVLRKSTLLHGWPVTSCQLPRTNRQHVTGNWQRQAQLVAKAGTRSSFDGYLFAHAEDDAVRAKLEAALQKVSPTHLEDFGECPQKFLLKHVLGARDVEDPEHELQMNARDKGKVDHGILERFYREVTAEGAELEPALASRIDALVDDAYDLLEREIPPFNRTMREIERAATRRILRDFLTRDLADLRANGLRPREFEYPCEATVEGIRVKGQIDRIDAGSGRYRVIDYKGGKATRHKDLGKKIDRGVRLQLPLYAMAVAQRFGVENVSGAIKPLVFPEVKADKFAFELAEKEAAVRTTLALFANAIVDGRFPAFPADTDKDFNACKYCPVSHSCRSKHDLAEKYAIVNHGDARTLLGGTE